MAWKAPREPEFYLTAKVAKITRDRRRRLGRLIRSYYVYRKMTADELLPVIHAINVRLCEPPLTEHRVARLIAHNVMVCRRRGAK